MVLTRSYLTCPACGAGVFFLNDQLELRPGSPLTPWRTERLVLLGASLPFAQAADLLARFTGVRVGEETVRRGTERTGALSYFARLADAETFGNLARGKPTAGERPRRERWWQSPTARSGARD